MRLGIVSDLHCNIAGLEKAAALMGPVDDLLCLGDSIYEYRFSNEVAAFLRDRGAKVILGNHEDVFFGPGGERARQAAWIDPGLMAWLGGQPRTRRLDYGGKALLMVHSTAWEPYGAYVYPHSREFRRFGEVDARFVLYGHTHVQVAERVGGVLVVNPGSAGDARDRANGRRLSFAVLDTESEAVAFTDFTV